MRLSHSTKLLIGAGTAVVLAAAPAHAASDAVTYSNSGFNKTTTANLNHNDSVIVSNTTGKTIKFVATWGEVHDIGATPMAFRLPSNMDSGAIAAVDVSQQPVVIIP